MFETSCWLFLKHLLLNIVVPFIPGLLFLWIFYGQKFKGFLLYILSWFIGTGVVAFSLLNIQFIHFGIGIFEYFIIVGILFLAFMLKLYVKKQSIKEYIFTLKLENIYSDIKKSFINLSLVERVFSIIISVFSIYFIFITGIFNFNLPTYAIDSFDNRNKPAFNIYANGGIELFGAENEILGKGKLGYPIQFPAYKALISQLAGGINDIYFNTRQRLVFLFGLLFIFSVTFNKTNNIFKSVLPVGLVCALPLIFFHSFEGYMDIPLAMYCVISLRLLYQYLETKDCDYISLGLLFGFVLSYIKNDGFVVLFPGMLMAMFLVLCINRNLWSTIKGFVGDRDNLFKSIGYLLYFFVPFLVVKIINGLGFNQAANVKSGMGFSDKIHWEIFPEFPRIFVNMDNYNLILIILLLVFIYSFSKNRKKRNSMLFLYTGILAFLILVAVFLFTENYQWFLGMFAVNRSFTVVFIILLGFSGILLHEE